MPYSVNLPGSSEYDTASDPHRTRPTDGDRARLGATYVCSLCHEHDSDIIVSVNWKGILYENVYLCATCFLKVWAHKETAV